MSSVLLSLLHSLQFMVRSRASLHLEIIALRHQLAVVHRSRRPRLRLTSADRALWAWLSQVWDGWRSAVIIVKPETGAVPADILHFVARVVATPTDAPHRP